MNSDKFFGFARQPTAKAFETGRLREDEETLKLYDTERMHEVLLGSADTAVYQEDTGYYPTAVELVTNKHPDSFLGFEGQTTAKPFGVGRLRDDSESYGIYGTDIEFVTDYFGALFLGFNEQSAGKPFEIGRFRHENEVIRMFETAIQQNDTAYYPTAVEIVSDIFDNMFLGFWEQPTGKPIGVGRFREDDESLGCYETSVELVTDVFAQLFFGFEGQNTGKPFDIGRFRDEGESYIFADTQRDVADVWELAISTRRIIVTPKEDIEDLIDHVEQMRQHYISEFQWEKGHLEEKPVLQAETTALGEELNEIRDAFLALRKRRWLDRAVGVQLDGIGEIVDMPRDIGRAIAMEYFGFSGQPHIGTFDEARFRENGENHLASYNLNDAEYKLVLQQKIIKNSSNGTTEELIRSLKFIFDAPRVIIAEPGNANIIVGIGRRLTTNQILLAEAVDLVIKGAGIGLAYKTHFNVNNYFGFFGQKQALGFEDGPFADIF